MLPRSRASTILSFTMTSRHPVIPYASRIATRSGLAPGTLMAIVALAVCAACVERLYPLVASTPFFGPSSWPEERLRVIQHLTLPALLAMGAILVLAGVEFGRWFLFGAFAAALLLCPLADLLGPLVGWSAAWAEWWERFSLGMDSGWLTDQICSTFTIGMLLWLLWTLARAAGKRTPAEEVPWRRIARITYLCILISGGCDLAWPIVSIIQRSLEGHFRIETYDIVWSIPPALLVATALSGLLGKRRAPVACAAALFLWWQQSVIADLFAEGGPTAIGLLRSAVSLPLLLPIVGLRPLLVLLILHPRIRHASSGDGEAGGVMTVN